MRFTPRELCFNLADGRTLAVPSSWYLRLFEANPHQQQDWEHADGGYVIRWPALGEKIDVDDLLKGTSATADHLSDFPLKLRAEPKLDSDGDLPRTAYVITDNADALYKPEAGSAARMTPGYGEAVDIIEYADGWVLVRWFGMQGWMRRIALNGNKPQERVKAKTHTVTSNAILPYPPVEVGARGGQFTRTKNGFRRYF